MGGPPVHEVPKIWKLLQARIARLYADWGATVFFRGGGIVTGHRTQLTIAITDMCNSMKIMNVPPNTFGGRFYRSDELTNSVKALKDNVCQVMVVYESKVGVKLPVTRIEMLHFMQICSKHATKTATNASTLRNAPVFSVTFR